MVEVFRSKKGQSLYQIIKANALGTKQAQGLPMYAIGLIIIGIVILAILLIFVLGATDQGRNVSNVLIGVQSDVYQNASNITRSFAGGT